MRRKRTVGIMVGIAVVAIAVTAWRSPLEQESVRVVRAAEAWAAANAAVLPKSFEDYSALSEPQRKAAYRKLAWPERQALWRSHLESFVLAPDELTSAQLRARKGLSSQLDAERVAFVRGWLDGVVPTAYVPNLTAEQRESIVAPFCEAAKTRLSRDQRVRILGIVGPADTAWASLLRSEATIRANRAARASFLDIEPLEGALRGVLAKAGLVATTYCTCTIGSSCSCGVGSGTYCANNACVKQWGCGCGWVFDCTGFQCWEE